MSAASYFAESCGDGDDETLRLTDEERKEAQAKVIEENVLLLQAQSRGYLIRRNNRQHSYRSIAHQNLTDRQVKDISQQTQREKP